MVKSDTQQCPVKTQRNRQKGRHVRGSKELVGNFFWECRISVLELVIVFQYFDLLWISETRNWC